MSRPLAALALAAGLCLAGPAEAVLTTYGAAPSFNLATGPNTLVDFSGSFFAGLIPTTNFWWTDSLAGFTLGGITFTVPSIGVYQAIVAPAFSPAHYERGTGNTLITADSSPLKMTFATPVNAFAFDLSTVTSRIGSTTLTFSNGDSAVVALGDPFAFHGFVSSTPFSSVTIGGISGEFLLTDNIRYAMVNNALATPEPASAALLALAAAALARRRRA